MGVARDLSLQEAATAMGKPLRQVRYMVKKGSVPAQKVDGEWRIPEEKIALMAGKSGHVNASGQGRPISPKMSFVPRAKAAGPGAYQTACKAG